MNWYQNDGREESGEGRNCSAANGPGSLVFTDDMTDGRSSRMNPEVNKSEQSDQIQPKHCRTDRMELHSTDG